MKHIIILRYDDGYVRKIEWGSIPPVWHVPVYWRNTKDGFIEENESSIDSTCGRKVFVLCGKEIKGHLWWKKIYGYYEENKAVENPDFGCVFDVRKKDPEAESLS